MLPIEFFQLMYSPNRIEYHPEGIWFLYETCSEDSKENFSLYCDIQDDLKTIGRMLADVEIEHDCIHGYFVQLEQ